MRVPAIGQVVVVNDEDICIFAKVGTMDRYVSLKSGHVVYGVEQWVDAHDYPGIRDDGVFGNACHAFWDGVRKGGR
jgi:hypothetical protein